MKVRKNSIWEEMIKWQIAIIFILLNLIMAAIYWPMLKQHWADIEAGRKEPIIEIEVPAVR